MTFAADTDAMQTASKGAADSWQEPKCCSSGSTSAHIQNGKELLGVTFYVIEVSRNGKTWEVERRFNDFVDLNSRLGSLSISLPSKGIVGFRNGSKFHERRLEGLNNYLEHLVAVSDDMTKTTAQKYIDVFLGFSRHVFAPTKLSERIRHSIDVLLEVTPKTARGFSSLTDNQECILDATMKSVKSIAALLDPAVHDDQQIKDDWAMSGR